MARVSVGFGIGPVRVSQRIGGGGRKRRPPRRSGGKGGGGGAAFARGLLALLVAVGLIYWTLIAVVFGPLLRLVGHTPGLSGVDRAGMWLWQTIPRSWEWARSLI